MIVITWTPLLLALFGFVLWRFAKDPKVVDAGRILFFCGMFWFAYASGGKTFRIG